MRLDGFLAGCTALTRKDARQAIRAGRVIVDGEPARTAAQVVNPDTEVTLDGQQVRPPEPVYLMLNKPSGVLSATTDASQPVITDLLPADLAHRVHPVGRLDRDTTGLLLVTSDGQWSHRITSPRHGCAKTYRVSLAEALTETACQQLENGVLLRNDPNPTLPATVERIAPGMIDLTISEGRYHQIKRMLAAVGNHVTALHRHRIGSLSLDPELEPGAHRHLSQTEIRQLAQPE